MVCEIYSGSAVRGRCIKVRCAREVANETAKIMVCTVCGLGRCQVRYWSIWYRFPQAVEPGILADVFEEAVRDNGIEVRRFVVTVDVQRRERLGVWVDVSGEPKNLWQQLAVRIGAWDLIVPDACSFGSCERFMSAVQVQMERMRDNATLVVFRRLTEGDEWSVILARK